MSSDLPHTESHNGEAGVSNFGKVSFFEWISLLAIHGDRNKLQKTIMLVLKGDQRLWWMDGRWCYYSKYWTNTQRESGCGCTFLSSHICIHVGVRLWNTYLQSSIREHLSGCGESVTHLFFTKRMATSTSSTKTRTPALIPAIFTTWSVCLAGSGMTSGSSVAPLK